MKSLAYAAEYFYFYFINFFGRVMMNFAVN